VTKPEHPTFWPKLIAARDEAAGVRALRFASPAGFRFVPGQFLMFHCADDLKTWRAYSLCSSPAASGEHFEVAVGIVGAFSERLGALKPGAEGGLVVRGPFGKWTYDGSAAHAVLVAGGTGVTPFRAMCLLKIENRLANKITLCSAAKTQEGLLFRNEYEAWKNHGINVNVKITRTGPGYTGRWTAETVFAAANDAAAVYFLCGPNGMVKDLKDGLQRLGVNERNIRTEKWGDYTDLF
jgi:ferredoxin-NADP reductase